MFHDVLLAGRVWNIPWFIGLICVAVLYIFSIRRYTKVKLKHGQPLLFFFCLSLIYITMGSPLAAISHFSFSLHMIQMSILYFIIPPIFLLGIPEPLFQQLGKIPIIKKARTFIFSPVISLSIFAVLFLLYHLPFVLNILSQYPFAHTIYDISLFILAFHMWWPVAAPGVKHRFTNRKRKRYVFLSGLILMPACLLFIVNAFMDSMNNPFLTEMTAELCLPASSDSIDLLPFPFNTKYDQIMAGVFMMALHKFGLMLTMKLGTEISGSTV